MYKIEKIEDKVYNITLTRGDTLFLGLPLYDEDDEPYTPVDGDSMRFAMKKKYKDEVCLAKINIPLDSYILEVKPEHTKELPFGRYVYDVEFTDVAGHITTILKGEFILDEEVD